MEQNCIIKKACFTGYRPEKFNFKLNNKNDMYLQLISSINDTLISLINDGCNVFYCGMAPGFDIIAAECVILLKKRFNGIRLVCAIPYLEHDSSINKEWIIRYKNVISNSDEIVYVSEAYHVSCFHTRNRYMVDMSDCVICWYDGKTGGTRNTIKYAQAEKKCIINLNSAYNVQLNNTQEEIPL